MAVFTKNARVCFVGDSITKANDYLARIVAHYNEHYPENNVKFFNCGVAGGAFGTALNLFDEDIIPYHPTHIVIMLGINDSARGKLADPQSAERYAYLKEKFDNYCRNLVKYCDLAEKEGAKIILCTPMPYAEYQKEGDAPLRGGFALMQGYSEAVRSFARKRNYPLVDYNAYITEVMQTETLYNPDRTHPTPHGHFFMAKCFLAFQGEEIGEEKPIPGYLDRWRKLVEDYRSPYSLEWMEMRDLDLPTDNDKYEYVKNVYLPEKLYLKRTANPDTFRQIAENYLCTKKDAKKNRALCDEIMENGFCTSNS